MPYRISWIEAGGSVGGANAATAAEAIAKYQEMEAQGCQKIEIQDSETGGAMTYQNVEMAAE